MKFNPNFNIYRTKFQKNLIKIQENTVWMKVPENFQPCQVFSCLKMSSKIKSSIKSFNFEVG